MTLAPHPFTLRQLQYVVAVADQRSFRRAAECCRVSQPSLSAQLAQVEALLGVRLFERSRQPVLLTSAGEELVARARQVLASADELVRAAQRLGDPLTGTLRIGVIPTLSPYLLPAVAPALRARFPKLTLAWIEEKTETLVQRLASGALEAALLALEADIGDVEHEVIARDPFVLALPEGHRLAKRRAPATLDELDGQPLLLLDEGHCLRNQVLAACKSGPGAEGRLHGVQVGAHEYRATSLGTLVQVVASGAGVTLLPGVAVSTEAERARIALRRLSIPDAYRTVALAWRKGTPLAPALREIAAAVREAYPKAQDDKASASRAARG